MRVKYWSYLLNDEGEPIENANIKVYLAGTSNAANTYTAETGGVLQSTAPQTTTNSEGYFEFWVADNNETNGYSRTQKFKISWNKAGVSTGTIDNVCILPIGPGYYYDTTTSWTSGASGYYYDVNHGLGRDYPVVQCYNSNTKIIESPAHIYSMSTTVTRIWNNVDTTDYEVVVIG